MSLRNLLCEPQNWDRKFNRKNTGGLTRRLVGGGGVKGIRKVLAMQTLQRQGIWIEVDSPPGGHQPPALGNQRGTRLDPQSKVNHPKGRTGHSTQTICSSPQLSRAHGRQSKPATSNLHKKMKESRKGFNSVLVTHEIHSVNTMAGTSGRRRCTE